MTERVRSIQKDISIQKKILLSVLIFVLGICLGIGSKALDLTAVNELPYIVQILDITNFLGRFAIWIFIAACISVYSISPKRAALNVLLFFVGMVSSYYLYSTIVGGFFPKTYAMIWTGITVISPFLAYVCWYAKGNGRVAIIISGVITGVLFSQAFLLFQGIRITYITEVTVWLVSLWLFRRKPKEFIYEMAISLAVAVLVQLFIPYWG